MRATYVSTATAIAALLAAATVPAHAQSARPLQFGLGVGGSMPTGAFRERVDAGAVYDANVAYRFGRSPLGLRADVSYSRYGLTTKYLDRFSSADNGNADMWTGTLDLTLRSPRVWKVQPYLLGGGGAYRRHVKVDRVVGEDVVTAFDPYFGFYQEVFDSEVPVRSRIETKFGWNAGGGLMIPVGTVHTFIEARYHDALTTGRHTGFVPILFGVQF